MRLGGHDVERQAGPERWVAAVRRLGYTAAPCPVEADAPDDLKRAYVRAAKDADIVIAEVGAWSNPIDPDDEKRKAAIEHNRRQLALADEMGACCCVNVSGSRGAERWAGPHPDNLTDETFDLIVETVREIIDVVKPTRTFYTLETMPWMYPDSADSYLRLIEAIDRNAFAVHFDPVNLISSPRRYFANADFLRDCFRKLGGRIKCCHAKDIQLADKLTVHLDEVRPGLGALDYRTFLTELDKLDPDVPLMIEHLKGADEYAAAAEHIRTVAGELGIEIR